MGYAEFPGDRAGGDAAVTDSVDGELLDRLVGSLLESAKVLDGVEDEHVVHHPVRRVTAPLIQSSIDAAHHSGQAGKRPSRGLDLAL